MSQNLTEIEKQILNSVDKEIPQAVLEKFSKMVRESGSEEERRSAEYLSKYLTQWDIQHTVHTPELYLSLPRSAELKVKTPEQKEFTAKTPAFSVSTNGQWMSGELVYLETKHAEDVSDIFSESVSVDDGQDYEGKVVMAEGIPMPGKVRSLEKLGVKAAVFISPGQNSHNAIATTIWGAPDLDNWTEEPKIPVLAITRQDGDTLVKLLEQGKVEVEYNTKLEKGWYPCPIIDIFIEGSQEPEKYVLLHGHLDSWHEGISDNATGNAALLEIARVFHEHRKDLRRSLRIAYWTGHSYGRYAGSTWFADKFGIDLAENCVAQVNCDSPGCKDATSYEDMMWTPEAGQLCLDSIKDATGEKAKGKRPIRAGDYSFNNIGITSYYMLSSVIPKEKRQKMGYYAVGGSGGHIEWHTEDDLLHVADLDLLVRDIKVYALTILRTLNARILPFNFAETVEDILNVLGDYQKHAEKHFDLSPAKEEAEKLKRSLREFDASKENYDEDKVNATLQQLARVLLPVNHTRRGIFRHDPALEVPPLPDLAPAATLKDTQGHKHQVTKTHLTRGQNRLIWALRQAESLLQHYQ